MSTTGTWTVEDLQQVGGAEELQLVSVRADGSLRPWVTMWVVRAAEEGEDGLFVRSARGATNPWFVRATAAGRGRVRAAGLEADVALQVVAAQSLELHADLDAAYHAKYDRYGAGIVGSVTGEQARAVTLRLVQLAG